VISYGYFTKSLSYMTHVR